MIARFCVLGLFVLLNTALTKDEELPLKERVKFLKFKLEDELKEKMKKKKAENLFLREDADAAIVNANYDYVDLSQVPITPINDKDDRKKNEKFKLRQLATTPKLTTTWTRKSSWPMMMRDRVDYVEVPTTTSPPLKLYNPLSDENIAKQKKERKEAKRTNDQKEDPKAAKSAIEPSSASDKPVEIFYKRQRRLLQDEATRDTPIQWTHCEDMITPFLTGMKGSLNMPMILGPTHRTVLRLVHLLTTDVSHASKEDIYSLMYQISNVQIRLFQWDGAALALLFDIICKGKRHTYMNIKTGLRQIFGTWHLDISNTTNLLSQSRLFRPACVNAKNIDGSTKSSKVTRYTKPDEPTTSKCDDDE